MSTEKRMVVVTTEYRGVFIGELVDRDGRTVVLENARCAIRWGTTGGWGQLAETGPTNATKLGSQFPRLELIGITSIADMSAVAIAAFRAAP